MNKSESATLLGVIEEEIKYVKNGPSGAMVITTDDVVWAIVPEDQPDADGKSGVMLLERYSGPFSI